MPFSETIQKWWPLPVSLDLVLGPVDVVASAVLAEVSRFSADERLVSDWIPFANIDEVFSSVSSFTNIPSLFFVLPTESEWTVLWNNSFLCDGYDSLCWCLTTNHSLTTMHWASSNADAVFQAGRSFTFRRASEAGIVERSVYCGKNDKSWRFVASGTPLVEEDVEAYTARHKRDRLTEQELLALLGRMNARPWDDEFYRVGKAFQIERVSMPSSIGRKLFSEFACKKLDD